MQDPEPQRPSRWKPTNKLIGGASLGTIAAQFIIALCDRLGYPLGPELGGCLTTFLFALAAYIIPNATSGDQ